MRILKRLIKEMSNQPRSTRRKEDGIIMEVDEKTHELMLKQRIEYWLEKISCI